MQSITAFTWRYAADTVMGGVSTGRGWVEDGVLRLQGTVSTANNGGFIQIRADLPHGLSGDAVHLRVRGNGERYFVHLRSIHSTRPWLSYRAGFDTGPEWAEVTLPLGAFSPSRDPLPAQIRAEDVRSIGIVAYGRDHDADVRVSHIGV
ncbi:CIA30 family protein [Rhodobacteraceae bacterium N5(2021)]|uniref:CIA30 family protein n=1 Tax=Gymnodinialimonas phycosphaerae TaxID=2841589 RepID=A0A975YFB6_9RHOB|nr:CIA30 family protein [Gymnodinialimonas phycosphaerae]MBY4894554.1 CIA30 family protein [Gymnodinialimonas phycosphaerae]